LLEKGTNLAGYRIDGTLGVGGMGVVYEATQLSLERTVALKLISADLGADEGFRERFRREGMIQAAIDHPHIVPVYEAGESEYGLFIAMRLIRGRNLKDLIVGDELTPARTSHLLAQVAGALDSAHEVGLIHRDIKPYNILVDDRREHAYLADFGVTKARSRPNLTKTGQMVGTLDYMAPEQIRGQSATAQTDIYALGCVLYECFTGNVPFHRETDAAVLYAHLSEPLPSVRTFRSELPTELDGVLGKAMAKKPEDRYESATALMRDVAVSAPAADTATPVVAPTVPSADDAAAAATVPPVPAQETEGPSAAPETALAAAAGTAIPSDAPETEAPSGPETVLATSTPPPETEVPAGPETVLAPSTPPPPTEAPPSEEVVREDARRRSGATVPEAAVATAAGVAAPPRRGPSKGLLIGGVIVLAAVLAGLGILVGRATGGGESTPTTSGGGTIASGNATIPYPDGWRQIASPPTIPGLGLQNVVSSSPPTSKNAGLQAGTTPRAWPSFLASGFRDRLPASAVSGRHIVRVGKLDAFRYENLRPKGFNGVVTVYVFPQQGKPTTTLACFATGGTTLPAACESMVAGTKIDGAETYQLTLPRDYAATLNTTLANVTRARSRGLQRMRAAGSAAKQATAASTIAAAYSSAAKSMQPANATPYVKPLNDLLVAALKGTSSAYRGLAAAARAENSARYDRANRRVTTREKRVRLAVDGFEALGFRVS
jgi:serine/threonine protein kinase